ncbi:MAG: 50S ribosomal protein L15 [Candidatus Omnitrophica bacterium]|nr:50S ribosomal protein L15 [Candidatus Omnitrophota bacterium]
MEKRSVKKPLKAAAAEKPKAGLKPKPKAKKEAPVQQVAGLHELKIPAGAHKRRKLLGRGPGSGHGKTSTRGSKGQTSRSGPDFYAGFEGGQSPLIRRMPKRGFTSKFKKEYQVVNIGDLGRIKEASVTLDVLKEKGLIKDKTGLVKVLGDGELTHALNVQAHAFSRTAMEKIQKAGGKAETLNATR